MATSSSVCSYTSFWIWTIERQCCLKESEVRASINTMWQHRDQLTGKIFIVNSWPLRAQCISRQVNDDLMALKGRIVKVLQIEKILLSKLCWSGAHIIQLYERAVNALNPELNPICYLLALLAHHFLHVSRIRVKLLTLRLLMSYIYGAPILDVSRSHTTTQHSR